jgi:hypothetical protein
MLQIGLVLLIIYAAVGLVVSIVVHLAAFVGFQPGDKTLFFAFHIGLIPLMIPVVFIASKLTNGVKQSEFWNFSWNNSYWSALLSGCPRWLKYTTYGFFVYAFVSFLFFVVTAPTIKQAAGDPPTSEIWRGFSGHWMFFYCAGLAILTTAYRRGLGNLQPRCPNGHAVGYMDAFCSICGTRLMNQETLH